MGVVQRVVLFVKATAVFAGCWLACMLAVASFTDLGPMRVPVATALAYVACLLLFAGGRNRRARPRVAASPATGGRASSGSAGLAAGLGAGAAAAFGGQALASLSDDAPRGWDDAFGSPAMVINPATGLPMVGDSMAGIDVGGNLYGTSSHDMFSTDHSFGSDSFSSHSFGTDHFGGGSSGSGTDPW